MWLQFIILFSIVRSNGRRLLETKLPTTSPSDRPTQKPSPSPSIPLPTKKPTSDPTNSPTYEWGPWGECIDCNLVTNVPSLNDLPYNACGCRESNRTCVVAFADYDCSDSGIEVKVGSCDADGLVSEITCAPTKRPTYNPSKYPSSVPTLIPTTSPTMSPSFKPTDIPTNTTGPTLGPTFNPTTNDEGEVVVDVSILFTGWPTSKSIADTLHPFSSIIEVDAEIIDIISWNYTRSSPYAMSVLYRVYLLSTDDAEGMKSIMESVYFSSSLSENILESWGNPKNIDLTVVSAYNNFIKPGKDLRFNEWAVAFLSFGCFLFLTICVLALLWHMRSRYKDQFRKVADEYGAMLNKTKEHWEMGEIYDTRSSNLQDKTLIKDNLEKEVSTSKVYDFGEEKMNSIPSLQKGRNSNEYTHYRRPNSLLSNSIVDAFAGVKDMIIEQQTPFGVTPHTSATSSVGCGSIERRSSFVTRQEHHECRKQVLKIMESRPEKRPSTSSEIINPLIAIYACDETDDKLVNVNTTLESFEQSDEDIPDTLVTQKELSARSEKIQRESTIYQIEQQKSLGKTAGFWHTMATSAMKLPHINSDV